MSEKKNPKTERVRKIFIDLETRPLRFAPMPTFLIDESGSMQSEQRIGRVVRTGNIPHYTDFDTSRFMERIHEIQEKIRVERLVKKLEEEEELIYTHLLMSYGTKNSERERSVAVDIGQSSREIICSFDPVSGYQIRYANE